MALDRSILDPATGLPKLPDGYAWQLDRSRYYEDQIHVHIVARKYKDFFERLGDSIGKLFGVKPDLWMSVGHPLDRLGTYCAPTDKDVLNTTMAIYHKVTNLLEDLESIDRLVGTYPPKSIIS